MKKSGGGDVLLHGRRIQIPGMLIENVDLRPKVIGLPILRGKIDALDMFLMGILLSAWTA